MDGSFNIIIQYKELCNPGHISDAIPDTEKYKEQNNKHTIYRKYSSKGIEQIIYRITSFSKFGRSISTPEKYLSIVHNILFNPIPPANIN